MEQIAIIAYLEANGFTLLFYFLALAFVIHAIITSYHWLTFGTKRIYGLAAIAVYLVVGAILLLTLAIIATSQ